MKIRHIGGIINRIEQLLKEQTALTEKIGYQQKNLINTSLSELQDETERFKIEMENVNQLIEGLNQKKFTQEERKIVLEHLETQKRFAEYIAKNVKIQAEYNQKYQEMYVELKTTKLNTMSHKTSVLKKGVEMYYNSIGSQQSHILDILYDMIEDLEQDSFYEHAIKLP